MSQTRNDPPFEICRAPDLYRDDYPVSYRLVILHAAWSYLSQKNDEDEFDSLDKLLEALNEAVNGNEDGSDFYITGFVELYSFTKDGKTGYVLIDRSKGCYPLVFYPSDDNDAHGPRIGALRNAVNDLLRRTTELQQVLSDADAWNNEVVNQLKNHFRMPEPKQLVDDDN